MPVRRYLLDGLQHGAPSLPGLGVPSDAWEARHAVPLPVLQLLMKRVSKQKHRVIYVKAWNLKGHHTAITRTVDANHQEYGEKLLFMSEIAGLLGYLLSRRFLLVISWAVLLLRMKPCLTVCLNCFLSLFRCERDDKKEEFRQRQGC